MNECQLAIAVQRKPYKMKGYRIVTVLIKRGGAHVFTFIHCADLHLDSPLRGLSERKDLPEEDIKLAARRALQNLVEMSIEEHVAFIVIAGDLYDGNWEDYETGLFFNRCMAQLGEHHIEVFIIRGNHDAASRMTKELQFPSHVHKLSERQPETLVLEDLHVAIHGQGFAQRDVMDNLVVHYPDAIGGYFNIGILHTSLEGQQGHAPYAPCRMEDLLHKGYQYWALGHIHKRQVLHEDPPIIYPGNLQGRHINETGPKGCTLVTVDGSKVKIEHRDLDVLRFYSVQVPLDEVNSDEAFHVAVSQAIGHVIDANLSYPLVLRIELTGRTSMHETMLQDRKRYYHEVESAALTRIGAHVWIEKVEFKTSSLVSYHSKEEQHHALQVFSQSITSASIDEEFLQAFLNEVPQTFRDKMSEYFQSPDATRVDSIQDVLSLIEGAEQKVLAMLTKGVDKK